MMTTFVPPGTPGGDDLPDDIPPNPKRSDPATNIIAGIVQDGALAIAMMLADRLAKVTHAPAFVVSDNGHPMLASEGDISDDGLHYWRPEQIVYRASHTF